MSDEKTTRAASGVKFSQFKRVGPMEGNPVEVVGLRDGENVRSPLTTDLVETNPNITFRNAKGQFAAVDPGVTALTNQLKVNRYFYERLAELGVPIGEDPPTETPQDGAFWFDNSEDVMQLFMWHAESDAWLPIAPPTTLEGRVASGEATQQAIIDQIQESLVEQQQIKNKVAALEGAVGEHSFVFDGANETPRDGEFILKDPGNRNTNMLSEGGIIAFSTNDREGVSVDWSKVNTGDVIRISSVGREIGELRIVTKAATSAFIYEYLGGDLDRLSELPYDCLLMSAFDPAGLATIDYVDAENLNQISLSGMTKGDTDHYMTGSIRTNNHVGYIWYEKDSAGYDEDRVAQLWNNGNKLQLDVQNGHKLQIIGKDGSGTKTFLTVQNKNGSGIDGVDHAMHLYHVAEPSGPQHAATKNYVDTAIANALANIEAPEPKPQPAYLMWEYYNRGDSAPPQDGQFFKNNDWWHFSYKTKNGVDLGGGPPSDKEWNAPQGGDCKYEMTLWEVTDGVWRMFKHIECYKAAWSMDRQGTKYFAFKHTWQSHDNSCKGGGKYYVTVGGFF